MWIFLKFVILLLLVSVSIVAIDQYAKKGARWKLWAAAAFLTCMLSALTFLVSPHDITSLTSRESQTALDSGGAGKITPGDSSGASETPQDQENDGAVNQDTGQTQNTMQDNGQNGAQKGGQQDGQQAAQQTTAIQQDLLLPVDEASLDAGFQEFRDSFLVAVQSKDLAFLKNHLSPNIRYSFGINNGINGFLREWQLDTSPAKSRIWHELDQILTLGGSFDKNKAVFTAPYVFSNFPATIDSFENVAVIRQNVSIHLEPDTNSSVVIGLSYKVLKLADEKLYKSTDTTGDSTTWRKVETSAGAGYVDNEYVRSPIDYRAQFRQENGVWKMIFFVAGD